MSESESVLSVGSEHQGVAPRSGSIVIEENPHAPLIDPECLWVFECKRGWQEGEQGVLSAIVDWIEPHIPPEQRWCVEFGCGDGTTLPFTCAELIGRPDWNSLLIDSKYDRAERVGLRALDGVTVLHRTVAIDSDNEDSIDSLMAETANLANPAVMVVDVDSIDYHIVEAMKSRPMVLCVETLDRNSPKDSPEPFIPSIAECGVYEEDGFGTQIQANAAAFDVLMRQREYVLVFRTRFNSIYVRGDMAVKLRKKKLNLGAGKTAHPGYTALDLRTGTDVRKLDYPDNSVDEVYSSHVLEHFPFPEQEGVLREWVRVLKPGGILRIAVPDMQRLGAEIAKDSPQDSVNVLQSIIVGGHVNETDSHHAIFTPEILRRLMNGVGVGAVREFKPFMNDCSRNPYSLNLEGTKRYFVKHDKPKVVLVLSQPRFTFSGHETALLKLARKMDFEIQPAIGAFWDRDMTIGTQAAINTHNPDYLMYSDYDSVFEESDVQKLLDAINADTSIAAIGSVQMSRHNDEPLVFEQDRSYKDAVSRVRFQHFGLTIIRREVFDEMPQPWFWSVPGKDDKGEWDWTSWGRSDADITFWRNMEILGFKVCQHNEVCIGHIVQCVKYPRDKGRGVQLIPIENYWKHGKPEGATFNPELFRKKNNAQDQSNSGG